MHSTLAKAVADMIGKKHVTETFAKHYISDHWIPFQIYMRVSLKIAEGKKQKPTIIRKPYTYKK